MKKCAECERLLRELGEALARLTDAQRQLARYRHANDEEPFQRLWDAADAAREFSQKLRLEMAAHLGIHGNLTAFPARSATP